MDPASCRFLFLLLCVITFPKFGTTHNHTGSATATASARKTGQNWFYSTYEAKARIEVASLPNDIGAYEMRVKVSGKKPPLRSGKQYPFTSGACAWTDFLKDDETYKKWGSGSDGDFKISASSSGCITGITTSASDSCTANYPQQP